MKKILFLGFVLLISLEASAQLVLEKEVLTKERWKYILKSKLGVVIHRDCFQFKYLNDSLILPQEWCFEDDLCESCQFIYYPISNSVFLLLMPNTAPIGTYLFYFDMQKKRAWCQVNNSVDSVSVLKYTTELYAVKLYSYEETNGRLDTRYVFFNQLNGVLLNEIIDLKGDSLIYKNTAKSAPHILFSIGNRTISIDYSKMKVIDKNVDYSGCIVFNKPFYSFIRKVMKK